MNFHINNNCVSLVWFWILQAATVKEYPEEMTVVFFYTFFITIQALCFSVIVENDIDAWKLTTGVEIMAIVCTVRTHQKSK